MNLFLVRRVEFMTVTVFAFVWEVCNDASSSEVEEKLKAELVRDKAPIVLGGLGTGFMVGTTSRNTKRV